MSVREIFNKLEIRNAKVRAIIIILYYIIYIYIYIYTECPGRNVPDFGRMFLKLK